MPRLATHLGQDAVGAEAYVGRRAGDPFFVEAGGVCIQRGEVVYEIRTAKRFQPLTRDNTFRLDIGGTRMRAISKVFVAHSLTAGWAFIAASNAASSSERSGDGRKSASITNRTMQDGQRAPRHLALSWRNELKENLREEGFSRLTFDLDQRVSHSVNVTSR